MTKALSIEEVKSRLPDFIKLDESTYKNTNTKVKFIDEMYGEWWATPNAVINRKRRHFLRGKETGREKKTTSIEDIKMRLPPYIKIDESTYIRQKIKCRFIDDIYGEWWSCPDHILRGEDHPARTQDKVRKTSLSKYGVEHFSKSKSVKDKTIKTNMERYGCKVSSQNIDVARKNAKSQTRAVVKNHWKTNEQITCVASYELAVVNYLNENKIDYHWQSKSFKMPNGKVYIPDLFLVLENKWVEIKGYFRKDAEEKWNWFHAEHPSSELWNKPVLKGMKIL